MSRFTSSENLISYLREGRLLALTAPLVIDQNVLIGYAIAPEKGYCAIIPINEFISICNSIYFQANRPLTFHGLKQGASQCDSQTRFPSEKRQQINDY